MHDNSLLKLRLIYYIQTLISLGNVQNTKNRKALSRLRGSAHRLAIEMGRWHIPNVIPRNERTCPVCYKLEDIFHFLL